MYKPFDAQEEDEFDDTISEPLETATEKGDEKLKEEARIEQTRNDEEPKKSRKSKSSSKASGETNEDMPPKLGNGTKNENNLARSV